MRHWRKSGFLHGWIFAVFCLAHSSCSPDASEARVIGSFFHTLPARSFIQDQEGVRFICLDGEKPEVKSITTSMSHKGSGGSRPAFAGSNDFDVEISLKEIPERCALVTAFGIPITDTYFRKTLSARYEIEVNGRKVAAKNIDDFRDRKNQAWFEERVDLSHLAGQGAEVLLKARVIPGQAGILRGWAEPRLMVTDEFPWTDSSGERPNVILILVDTLRADHLSCYGYERPTSPRLDAFASRSLLFENAIAPSSWTWPSTATVLTGQYPLRHGVVDAARSTLSLEKLTLAEIGMKGGMRTAAFISNPLINEAKNFDQGFVDFFDLHWADAEALVDRFAEWLGEAKAGRFLAYLHFMDPHGPYAPPDEYIARFSDPDDAHRISDDALKKLKNELGTFKRQPSEQDRLAVKNAMDRYDSEILFWDARFGRLLDLLENEGLAGNTLIVVTSDHGEEFLEHDILGHGWTLFDISLRVPLILGGPGIEPGRVKDQVELISLLPTLLDAAGLKGGAAEFDGSSLLKGKQGARMDAAYTHTEHAFSKTLNRRAGLYALRTEKWKLIYDPNTKEVRLYDLERDQAEKQDLASDQAYEEVRRRFTRAMEEWIEKLKESSPAQGYYVDDETLKAFEQLGYLGH